jgi:hypothetical protein
MSIKDRWVGPREQVLITYWSYRPVNRFSMFVNRCLTFITALMVVLGEKLGGGHADQSVGVLKIVLGAIFLGSSMIRPTLLGQRERLPRTGTVHRKHTSGVREPTQEAYVTCVSGFPYRCTSIRIVATFRYE